MQILTAPTGGEIDLAHAAGRWLDIGVLSMRNLRWISRERMCIWILLGLTSLPLHLVYNSAVYDTLTANKYDLYIASESRLSNAPLADADGPSRQGAGDAANFLDMARKQELERLDPVACIQAYGKSFVSERKDLALICSEWNYGLQWSGPRLPIQPLGERASAFPYDWICGNPDFNNITVSPVSTTDQPCLPNTIIDGIKHDGIWKYLISSSPNNNTIEYCLSQKTPEHCQLQFSVEIMVIVIIANFLKVLCMLYTIWRVKSPTLVTIRDAISSFLQSPDHTTIDRCTLSKVGVEESEMWFSRSKPVPGRWKRIYQPVPAEPQPWTGKTFSWSDGVSKTRRYLCYFW